MTGADWPARMLGWLPRPLDPVRSIKAKLSVALGLAGGVRQSTLVLLLPLWLFVAARSGRSTLLRGLVVLAGTCLLWLVPLIYLAGGPRRYYQAGASLLGFVGEKTSVLYGGAQAVLGNLAQVGAGLVVGLNLSLLVVGLALALRCRARRRLARREWLLLGLWAATGLLCGLGSRESRAPIQ